MVLSLPSLAAVRQFQFDRDALGSIPPGFKSSVTGQGAKGDWQVIADTNAPITPDATAAVAARPQNVLAQLARDPTDEHFPLLIYEPELFEDFTCSVELKTVDGKIEQMAGVAFRIQDENNYYFVRGSSLGGTFKLFRLLEGTRTPLLEVETPIPRGEWHTLTVECKGSHIRCLLNDRQLLPPPAPDAPKDAPPPTLIDGTFPTGRIGLWTKSDSVSHFRNLRITYEKREILAQRLVQDAMRVHPRLLGVKICALSPAPGTIRVIASSSTSDLGKEATREEESTAREGKIYHGKGKDGVSVLLPLLDRNGDPIAAVRIRMKGFPGQTQANAVAKARTIIQEMQEQARNASDLTR